MNPIAILAFLASLGTGTPAPQHPERKTTQEQAPDQNTKPTPPAGHTERAGGGWDAN